VYIDRTILGDSVGGLRLQQPLLNQYMNIYRTEGTRHSISHQGYLSQALLDVLRTKGVIEFSDAVEDGEEEVLVQALQEALQELCLMRASEGTSIAKVLQTHMKELESLFEDVVLLEKGNVDARYKKAKERIATLLSDVSMEPDRMLQELAVLSDKLDVTEEMDRLRSHFRQFQEIISSGPCGRKVEFLLQEFGREWNTLGVKVQKAEVQSLVVEAKTILEKLREQALNLE